MEKLISLLTGRKKTVESPKKISHYKRVKQIIKSCTTIEHLKVADQCLRRFSCLYSDELLDCRLSEQMYFQKIQVGKNYDV